MIDGLPETKPYPSRYSDPVIGTKGRALDRIGFDVKNPEALQKTGSCIELPDGLDKIS